MNLEVKVDGGALQRHFEQMGSLVLAAGNAAVVAQTVETRDAMRAQVAVRLSGRAANALTSQTYANSGRIAGGLVYSRWWRRARATGEEIDMFAAFERGDVVRAVRGQFLAIPLPAAYAVVGIPRGTRGRKRPPSPVDVEAALDTDLFVLKRGGRPSLLCAKDVKVTNRAHGSIRGKRYRNAKGGFSQRRTPGVVVPMFVLLKNSRLPRRLDFEPVVGRLDEKLAEKFYVELARAGVLDD